MPGDAYGVFLLVASVCVVILTIFASVVTVVLVWTGVEVLRFVRIVRHEAEVIVAARRTILKRARYAERWLTLFLEKALDKFL